MQKVWWGSPEIPVRISSLRQICHYQQQIDGSMGPQTSILPWLGHDFAKKKRKENSFQLLWSNKSSRNELGKNINTRSTKTNPINTQK